MPMPRSNYNLTEVNQIVDFHNFLRLRKVVPSTASASLLRWDSLLASLAQAYADKCLWEMGQPEWKDQLDKYGRGVLVGQNLFKGSASRADWNAVFATQMWFDEYKYFDYCANKCQPERVCGHYTQVIWDDSTHIGCGFSLCPTIFVLNDTGHHVNIVNTLVDGVSLTEVGIATLDGDVNKAENWKSEAYNLIVCNYYPPGNMDVHKRRPFLTDDDFCEEP